MSLLKNKKSQGNVTIAVSLYLMCTGITIIVAYLILSNFISYMSVTTEWTADMQTAANGFLGALQILDYIMVLLMIILIVGIGITSYRLAAPPIFAIITLISASFYGFFSYFLSYVFQVFAGDSAFTAILVYFPRTVLICTNLHWVALAGIVIGVITLYAKKPQGQYL